MITHNKSSPCPNTSVHIARVDPRRPCKALCLSLLVEGHGDWSLQLLFLPGSSCGDGEIEPCPRSHCDSQSEIRRRSLSHC